MSKLIDIVRLVLTTSLSDRRIAASLGVSKNTVRRYRAVAMARGYTWDGLASLEFPAFDAAFNKGLRRLTKKRMPDFTKVYEEMQKAGVTLLLLWEEHRAVNPDDALSYSQFTHHYRKYVRTLGLVMRQTHRPGERIFVDFSGTRPGYIDPVTGQYIAVELFVAAHGHSHYIFATCVPSQALPHWIASHVKLFEFSGGVPLLVVPDNLRSAVTRSGNPPTINRIYRELARHYGTTILPARPRKPRDKGKVEVAVQIVQRWIIARLRHRTFFSIAELNTAVAELVCELNERPFKRLPGCRRSRFELVDKPALRPLPAAPFVYAEWTGVQTVGPDYHVPVRDHWYSVPHRLVGCKVDARITGSIVEIFHQHTRVASHVQSDIKGGHTTSPDHQPERHRAYAERTPERFFAWAEGIGPNTLTIVRHQFNRGFPEMGLPACDTLQKLARKYGTEALEAAAKRAIEIKSLSVKSVRSLLSTGRYAHPMEDRHTTDLPSHHNVRGASYYANGGR